MRVLPFILLILAISANADQSTKKTIISDDCKQAIFAISDTQLYDRVCLFYGKDALGINRILNSIATINQNVEYAKSICPADLTEIEYNLIEQQNPNQHLSSVNPTKIMENPQAIAFCERYKQIPAE